MALTPYPYDTGKDPQFDAFKAKYDYNKTNAEADAEMRRKKADEDYQAALANLNTQGEYGRRNLDTSLLSRGVFQSGEANRRRAELESSLLSGRAAADQSNANTLGGVSSDLQRAMTGLDLDWESAASAALGRMSAGGGSGGGGSSRRTTTPAATIPPYVAPTFPTVQRPGAGMGRDPRWGVGVRPGGYGQPAPRQLPRMVRS